MLLEIWLFDKPYKVFITLFTMLEKILDNSFVRNAVGIVGLSAMFLLNGCDEGNSPNNSSSSDPCEGNHRPNTSFNYVSTSGYSVNFGIVGTDPDGDNTIDEYAVYVDGAYHRSYNRVGAITTGSIGNLSTGSHSLSAKAIDSCGDEDLTPAVENFNITEGDGCDGNVPPNTFINSIGVNGNYISAYVCGTDPQGNDTIAGYLCGIYDTGAYEYFVRTGNLTEINFFDIPVGDHTLYARAIDICGEGDMTPAEREFIIE